ncbi:MAG: trypsin-like peptidase domain-containing protein [Planctomycetota bacterium]|nr:MAG: trypsin-like peptidase domain-containing protein [Planctomycetota bacterium]
MPLAGRPALVKVLSVYVIAVLTAICYPRTTYAQSVLEILKEAAGSKLSEALRIYGTDDRAVVTDTTQFPYSAIGQIQALFGPAAGYEIRLGTGVLISNKVVLTCAHVVYETGPGWADNIVFIPGKKGDAEPYGRIKVVGMSGQNGYLQDRNDEYDIALLLLETAVGQQTGYMSAVFKPTSFFTDRSFNLTGYPYDITDSDLMYNAVGQSQRIEGNLIVHYIDGGTGQSGGPLWYETVPTKQYIVVGIYTGDIDETINGQLTGQFGVAIHINETFCNWIDQFIDENDPGSNAGCSSDGGEVAPPACGSGAPGGMMVALLTLGAIRGRRYL